MSAVAYAQVMAMLGIMQSKIGDPYTEEIPERFGPGQFDCSGLVWYAANQAGIPMPGGPDDDEAALAPFELEWAAGLPGATVLFSGIQEGDLLGFLGADPAPFDITLGGRTFTGPGHIGMATSSAEYVSAYDTVSGVCLNPIAGTGDNQLLVAVRMAAAPAPDAKFPAPEGLHVVNAGYTTVKLAWDAVDGATEYGVFIRHNGVLVPTYARTVTTPEFDGGGLEENTTYTAGVQAIRPSARYDPGVSAKVTFTTGSA
jgi:hypothetical protein